MEIKQKSIVTKEVIYKTLSPINVNDHTEKKGRFTYLSWTWAISELQKHFPNSSWKFDDDLVFADGSMEVRCVLNIEGHEYYMWLAVMDNRNQAIQNPSSTHINKARMRCLTKAIAVAGLGFYIFEGEDLPRLDTVDKQEQGSNLHIITPKVNVISDSEDKAPLLAPKISIADTIVPAGKEKGKKTYAEVFTNNKLVAEAIKYWDSNAKDENQLKHLSNLKTFQKDMALDVKGVA